MFFNVVNSATSCNSEGCLLGRHSRDLRLDSSYGASELSSFWSPVIGITLPGYVIYRIIPLSEPPHYFGPEEVPNLVQRLSQGHPEFFSSQLPELETN